MTSQEAAAIVRAMSTSLASNPGQFQPQVSITGQNVASHGGTGLSISATGGGPGSTTIGQTVSAVVGNVQITQGNQAFTSQLEGLVKSLETIASELEARSPNPSKVRALYESLLGTWVPGVITSVVGNVLSAALGI